MAGDPGTPQRWAGFALAACALAGWGCSAMPIDRTAGGAHARGVARRDAATVPQVAPVEPSTPDSIESEVEADPASATAALSPGDLPEGLIVEELRPGEGEACGPDSLVVIEYRGSIVGGEVFGRTEPGQPRGPWPVAALAPGLRDGMIGMREGGRRRITVPPQLGYGDDPVVDEATGEVVVPGGSTLVFVVDLIEVVARPSGEAE